MLLLDRIVVFIIRVCVQTSQIRIEVRNVILINSLLRILESAFRFCSSNDKSINHILDVLHELISSERIFVSSLVFFDVSASLRLSLFFKTSRSVFQFLIIICWILLYSLIMSKLNLAVLDLNAQIVKVFAFLHIRAFWFKSFFKFITRKIIAMFSTVTHYR